MAEFIVILNLLGIIAKVVFNGVGIFALLLIIKVLFLVIKSLKIYINKNS